MGGVGVLGGGGGTGLPTGTWAPGVGLVPPGEMRNRARSGGVLFRADLMHPPFRPETFDTLVFAGSFYYLPNPYVAAKIVADLLRPGGRVLILSPASQLLAPFVRGYRPGALRRVMENARLGIHHFA